MSERTLLQHPPQKSKIDSQLKQQQTFTRVSQKKARLDSLLHNPTLRVVSSPVQKPGRRQSGAGFRNAGGKTKVMAQAIQHLRAQPELNGILSENTFNPVNHGFRSAAP